MSGAHQHCYIREIELYGDVPGGGTPPAPAFRTPADGIHPATDGTLRLSVPAQDDAKFVIVGASYGPIHEGDTPDSSPNP